MAKEFNENILYIALVVIIVLSIMSAYFVFSKSQTSAVDTAKAKEAARLANIEVVKLTADCLDCFNIDKVLTDLKTQNVNVVKEESVSFSSDKGKELVSKFGITKFPSLIVSGEVKKSNIEAIWKTNWEEKEGSFVYNKVLPPYTNLKGEVVGKVSVVSVFDSSCEKCGNLSVVVGSLKKAGVVLSEEKYVEYSSAEGQLLVKKFNLQKIPVLLISNNVLEYPSMDVALAQIGANQTDGSFVVNTPIPPYKDLKTNEVKGFVNVTYLADSSCKGCYNVSVNKAIIENYGLFIVGEKNVDINSTDGLNLIKKYKIDKVPIILISPEAKEYSGFAQVWTQVRAQVGTVESDGWFVMRNPELLGGYKNLTSGQEVVAAQAK